jgi:hypothetical protein
VRSKVRRSRRTNQPEAKLRNDTHRENDRSAVSHAIRQSPGFSSPKTPDFVLRALTWLNRYSREFSRCRIDGTVEPDRLKALAELAVMLFCYVRATGDRQSDPVQRIIGTLTRVQNNEAFQQLPLRSPDEFVPVCDVYSGLRLVGHDVAEQRAILERVINSGILNQIDRLPQGHMEVQLSVESAGLGASWKPQRQRALAPIPDAILLGDDQAYALTHTIMFQTDFGAHPERLGSHALLRDRLSMLLIRYCRERSYDLLAETLLCWDAIRLSQTPLTNGAWNVFLLGQDRWGGFPSRHESNAPVDPNKRPRPSRRSRFFRHYHTTLLAVIAGCLHAVASSSPRYRVERASQLSPTFAVAHVSRSDVIRAIRSALAWLTKSPASSRRRYPAELCYRALAGWIGTSTGTSPTSPHDLDETFQTLWRCEEGVPLVRISIPATLKILMAALFMHRGRFEGSLVKFLKTVVGLLRPGVNAHLMKDFALLEKRIVLFAIGACPRPRAPDYSDMIEAARRTASDGGDEHVDDLLLRLECFAELGTRSSRMRVRDEWIGEYLIGVAQCALGMNDWTRACRSLRIVKYLALDGGSSYDSCISYVLNQQMPDGSFGYLGCESRKFAARKPGISFDVAVRTPVTVDCLWTLSELVSEPGWRLYATLPRLARGSLQ